MIKNLTKYEDGSIEYLLYCAGYEKEQIDKYTPKIKEIERKSHGLLNRFIVIKGILGVKHDVIK